MTSMPLQAIIWELCYLTPIHCSVNLNDHNEDSRHFQAGGLAGGVDYVMLRSDFCFGLFEGSISIKREVNFSDV